MSLILPTDMGVQLRIPSTRVLYLTERFIQINFNSKTALAAYICCINYVKALTELS